MYDGTNVTGLKNRFNEFRREGNQDPHYLAILLYSIYGSPDPDPPTGELLTYTSLIIRDALRAGGDGLLTYDRLFREHAVSRWW